MAFFFYLGSLSHSALTVVWHSFCPNLFWLSFTRVFNCALFLVLIYIVLFIVFLKLVSVYTYGIQVMYDHHGLCALLIEYIWTGVAFTFYFMLQCFIIVFAWNALHFFFEFGLLRKDYKIIYEFAGVPNWLQICWIWM